MIYYLLPSTFHLLGDTNSIQEVRTAVESVASNTVVPIPETAQCDTNSLGFAGGLCPQDHLPASIYGDGDCLFSSISVSLIGCDILRRLLRFTTYLELRENKHFYLDQIIEKGEYFFLHSEISEKENLLLEAGNYEALFVMEVERGVKVGCYASFLHVWGLASVLKRPIMSIYPGDKSLESLLTRVLHPREDSENTLGLLRVQWTNAEGVTSSFFKNEIESLIVNFGLEKGQLEPLCSTTSEGNFHFHFHFHFHCHFK